jgi:hypothetical protein
MGADKEASTADGTRPLHYATQQGHLEVVKALTEMGADKEAPAVGGFTPLHDAAWHGHAAVVTTLVESGADIGALMCSGEMPLQLSIRFGQHAALELWGSGSVSWRAAPSRLEQAARRTARGMVEASGAKRRAVPRQSLELPAVGTHVMSPARAARRCAGRCIATVWRGPGASSHGWDQGVRAKTSTVSTCGATHRLAPRDVPDV